MLTLISKILDNGVKVFVKELAMLTTQNYVTWAPIPLVGISESSTDTRMVACHFLFWCSYLHCRISRSK